MTRTGQGGWSVGRMGFTLLALAAPAAAGPVDLLQRVTPALNVFGVDYVWANDPIERGQVIRFGGNWDNRTYDVGLGDLTLDGSFQSTFGYGTRGIPHIDWDITTPQGLTYQLQTKTGVEDLRILGNVNISSQGDANLLGFYSMNLSVSNRGTIEVLGQVDADETLDFDLGPISVRGNAFVDLAVAVLDAAGVDTSDIDSTFGRSVAQGKSIDAAQTTLDRLAAGESISTAELGLLTSLEALGSSMGLQLVDGLGAEELALAANRLDTSLETPGYLSNVPEPASVGLLLAGLALIRRRR